MIQELHIDVDQLESLLDDSCDPQLYLWATRHLESCDACRERLEKRAAEASWWSCAEGIDFDVHAVPSTISPVSAARAAAPAR